MISNGNRTEGSPIRTVFIRVVIKSLESGLSITSMNANRIEQHEVLLLINYKNYNVREKKKSQVMKERENLP